MTKLVNNSVVNSKENSKPKLIDSPQKTQWKRLFGYFLPLRNLIFIGLVGLCLFSAVDAGMVYFIKPLVDQGLAESNGGVLRFGAVLVIVIFLLRGVGSFIANYSVAYVSSRITCTLRQQAFVKLQSLPLRFFEQNSSGSLISKITYDAEQVSVAISSALVTVTRESLIILILLAMMFYASWQLSVIFLLIGPAIAFIIINVSTRFKRVSVSLQNAMGGMTKVTERSISNHQDVLILDTADQMAGQFWQVNNTNRRQTMKLASITHLSNPFIQLIASFAIAAVLLLASLDQVLVTLTPGTFTMVLMAMGSLLRPLKQLTNVNQQLQKGATAATSLFALLDQCDELDEGHINMPSDTYDIRFNQLTFYHGGMERPAIKEVNVSIPAGKTYALVGASGGGKTTLVKLLLRLYPCHENTIFINEIPIESMTLTSLRALFSVVSQDIVLTDDTLANNISYGCRRAVSRQDIEAAAEAANVTDFAQHLDDGLDSMIGENGRCLSGGQRQRVAIARAILRNSPFILLDEATSALDNQSEHIIKRAFSTLGRDKTLLIIAHRLSTIEDVDQILVMHKGELVEQGTHRDLIQKKGFYWTLYEQQDT